MSDYTFLSILGFLYPAFLLRPSLMLLDIENSDRKIHNIRFLINLGKLEKLGKSLLELQRMIEDSELYSDFLKFKQNIEDLQAHQDTKSKQTSNPKSEVKEQNVETSQVEEEKQATKYQNSLPEISQEKLFLNL